MKKLLLLALVSFSSMSFAQRCEVDMVDRYGRWVRTFQAQGDANCMEGMKACRKFIRLNTNQYGSADCVVAGSHQPIPQPYPQPQPQPYPQPIPQPYPNPYPQPDYSVQRSLRINESVILSNQVQTVIGYAPNGTYALKDVYGYIKQNIRREDIAITADCSSDLCVNDSLIDTSKNQEVKIAGLEFDGQYVTKDVYGYLTSNNDRLKLAVKSGCVRTNYTNVCVGNQVLDRSNQYKTVVAVQINGLIVLKDVYGYLTSNVNPNDLVITR